VQAGTVLADAALMTTTTTDHDPIDFTFADDGDLVRKAPKAVPEDPMEKRLQREREAARFIPISCGEKASGRDGPSRVWDEMQRQYKAHEIKHGSGKVKV
jgi:hypothetical protein